MLDRAAPAVLALRGGYDLHRLRADAAAAAAAHEFVAKAAVPGKTNERLYRETSGYPSGG
jgi:hypothetical protein